MGPPGLDPAATSFSPSPACRSAIVENMQPLVLEARLVSKPVPISSAFLISHLLSGQMAHWLGTPTPLTEVWFLPPTSGSLYLTVNLTRDPIPSVVAIPGCHLDYIWNELQSRIGRLTYDPNLEAQRYKFLTWT